jgi:hypothetical protein
MVVVTGLADVDLDGETLDDELGHLDFDEDGLGHLLLVEEGEGPFVEILVDVGGHFVEELIELDREML